MIALSPDNTRRESSRGIWERAWCHFPWCHFPWLTDVSTIPRIVMREVWDLHHEVLQKSDLHHEVLMSSCPLIAAPVSVRIPLSSYSDDWDWCTLVTLKRFFVLGFFFPGQIHRSSKMFSKYRLNENIFFRLLVTFFYLVCIQSASALLASVENDKWLHHYLSENNIPLCFSLNRIMPYLMGRKRLNEDTGPTLRV